MAKKKARKKKSKSSATPVFLLLIVIIAVIAAGLYLNQKSTESDFFSDFINSKQEIRDVFGKISEIKNLDKTDLNQKTETKIHLSLKGDKQSGELFATAFKQGEQWLLKDIVIKTPTQDRKVASLYISSVHFYGASLSSAPLYSPVFGEGEDIFIVSTLSGITPHEKGTKITQSLNIYDQDNQLIAGMKDVAHYEQKEFKAQVPFTNKIKSLSPGTYYIEMIFTDINNQQKETYWQEITVKALRKEVLTVKSVSYATDSAHKNPLSESVATINQLLYVSLALDGFHVQDGKISGIVDLDIINSEGSVVAHKPKFAAFTKTYDPDSEIVVDGKISLADPDIYLLSFQIKDFFSKNELPHEEKLLVSLPKK